MTGRTNPAGTTAKAAKACEPVPVERDAGFDVHVATVVSAKSAAIRAEVFYGSPDVISPRWTFAVCADKNHSSFAAHPAVRFA